MIRINPNFVIVDLCSTAENHINNRVISFAIPGKPQVQLSPLLTFNASAGTNQLPGPRITDPCEQAKVDLHDALVTAMVPFEIPSPFFRKLIAKVG